MKQTEKYKLNLIETDDAFSPNPLNENTEKVEAQLAAVRAEAAAGDAALAQRLTTVEAHRIVCGNYVSTGAIPLNIQLGFTPKALFVYSTTLSAPRGCIVLPGYPFRSGSTIDVQIVEGGFSLTGSSFNRDNISFNYVAVI